MFLRCSVAGKRVLSVTTRRSVCRHDVCVLARGKIIVARALHLMYTVYILYAHVVVYADAVRS